MKNALVAYEELKDKFPTNRFGRNAIPNIKKQKKYQKQKTTNLLNKLKYYPNGCLEMMQIRGQQ